MDDFVLNVRQIGNYPEVTKAGTTDLLLLQINGLGGAYASISATDLVGTALSQEGALNLAPGAIINWNGAQLGAQGSVIVSNVAFSAPSINTNNMSINGSPVATEALLDATANAIIDNTVWSFNKRRGDILLTTDDVLQAGGAPITNPHFNGWVTAPTAWNGLAQDDTVATTAFVWKAICEAINSGILVSSYNGRSGHVVPIVDDVTTALTAVPGTYALANNPPTGDASRRLATTFFVDDSMAALHNTITNEITQIASGLDQQFAPINSPQFTGIPTGPTAAQTVNSGQLATTAFVHAAIVASTTGVSSFNTRTGAVVLTTQDVTDAGGAPIASPQFTGHPMGVTEVAGDSSTRLATTAFVQAAVAAVTAGVSSFNTRTGAVVLQAADVTGVGGALLASPALSGVPTAPTASPPTTNTTQIATTQFVQQVVAALPAPVSSFNGRTGAVTFQASDISAVGGALLAGPIFTGNPTAPTQTPGTSNQTLATTAFVAAAVAASTGGVSSFNTRTGAVTLTGPDITGAGGALLASPTFTGVPAAPTATSGTNTNQLATTAFVQAALAAAPGGVSSFNTRTGAIVFQASDVSAVGGALLNSPSFTGNPTAPTASPGDNDTSIATTAFVQQAIATAGGVNSFNGRAGVVTLTSTDVFNAEGAIYQQSDVAPTAGPQTLWFDSIHGQLYVRYVDPSTSAQNWVIANSVSPPPNQAPASGTRVLIQSITVATNGQLSVVFSGLTNTYDEYVLEVLGWTPYPAADSLAVRVSQDGGTTWISGAASYSLGYVQAGSPGGSSGAVSGASYAYLFLNTTSVPNGSNYSLSGTVRLFQPMSDPANRPLRYFMANAVYTSASGGGTFLLMANGGIVTNGSLLSGGYNAIQVIGASGNGHTAGSIFKLYGIAK